MNNISERGRPPAPADLCGHIPIRPYPMRILTTTQSLPDVDAHIQVMRCFRALCRGGAIGGTSVTLMLYCKP